MLPCAYTTKLLEFQLRKTVWFWANWNQTIQTFKMSVGSSETLLNGNELVRSAQFLVLAYDDNGMTTQMICDMKKTQMKVAIMEYQTRWSEDYAPDQRLFNPPIFTPWKLTRSKSPTTKVRGSTTNWRGVRWSPCQC